MKQKTKKTILVYVSIALGLMYCPFFVLFFIILKIARLVLAICYFGLLDPQKGKDILKSIFRDYDYY